MKRLGERLNQQRWPGCGFDVAAVGGIVDGCEFEVRGDLLPRSDGESHLWQRLIDAAGTGIPLSRDWKLLAVVGGTGLIE